MSIDGNMGFFYVSVVRIDVKCIGPVYDLLNSWFDVKKKLKTQGMTKYIMWNKSEITIDDKLDYYKQWADDGIKY